MDGEGPDRGSRAGPVAGVREVAADVRGAHSKADFFEASALFGARHSGQDGDHSRKTEGRRAFGRMHRVPWLGPSRPLVNPDIRLKSVFLPEKAQNTNKNRDMGISFDRGGSVQTQTPRSV